MGELTFNEVELGDYGLTVLRADEDRLDREIKSVPLADTVYAWRSIYTPKRITVAVHVVATASEDIYDLLSQCRGILNQATECKLELSTVPDRYWWAIFRSMRGDLLNFNNWKGDIEFFLPDPRAFDVTLQDVPVALNPDPKTFELWGGEPSCGGIQPVYLLEAGNNLVAITLVIENETLGEALTWVGDLGIGEKLEIDVPNMIVKKDPGGADMATVSGVFPTLQHGVNNMKVTSFNTGGDINIKYRYTYI